MTDMGGYLKVIPKGAIEVAIRSPLKGGLMAIYPPHLNFVFTLLYDK